MRTFWLLALCAGLVGCDLFGPPEGMEPDAGARDAGNLTSDGEEILPSAQPRSLAMGDYSFYAVTTDGKVRAWGSATSGALGPGMSHSSQFVPREVTGLPAITAVAAGDYFACALAADQTVWCWGENENGQLGKALPPVNSAATEDSDTPSKVVGVSGATQVVANDDAACALVAGGAVMCWGSGSAGQLGDGDDTTHFSGTARAVPNLTGVKFLTGYASEFAAVTAQGAIVSWGNGSSTPTALAGFDSGYVKVGITGGAFVGFVRCGITTAGAVKCAGNHSSREVLGRGTDTTSDASMPTQVEGLSSGATELAMGSGSVVCAIANGALECWGQADGSQNLGGGGSTHDFSSVPAQVLGATSGVSTASRSSTVSCFIVNGAARCWGNQRTLGQPFFGDVDSSEPSAVVSLP